MFLSAIDIEKVREGMQSRPLIVTKDTPRKAYFRRMNRGRYGQKTIKRLRSGSHVLRGNSFAGNANSQRVVVKINPVKNKSRKVFSGALGGGVSVGGSGSNLYHHVNYISRSGAGGG